ncbi:MAG: hypothetical protein ACLT29_09460 [Ruminococcus callidus]
MEKPKRTAEAETDQGHFPEMERIEKAYGKKTAGTINLRQYRTKIVRQMRRQIFRQMKQKAE